MSRTGRKSREQKRRKPASSSSPASSRGTAKSIPAGLLWIGVVIAGVVIGGVLFSRFGMEDKATLSRLPDDASAQGPGLAGGSLGVPSPEVLSVAASPPPPPPSGPPPAVPATTGPDAGYIGGTQSCAECHTGIVESYSKIGMGRSISRPAPENSPEDYTTNTIYYHEPSRQYFRMVNDGGKFFQERWQKGPRGENINFMRTSVDYIIGSGNHARSYIHMGERGEAYQLPVTWYPKPGKWAMSPGYDTAAHSGFSRRITYDCAFCHAAVPKLPAGRDYGNYPETSIFPHGFEAIDCERCHGPAAKHVELARAKAPTDQVKSSILNPADLSTKLQMDVCMSCHLETTSDKLPHSVAVEGKLVYSWRPGQDLEDYKIHLDHPRGVGYDDKFEIAHQAYRLRKSKCFIESEGRMTCTTCHDPHRVPKNRVAAGIASCMTCHNDGSCKETPRVRALEMNNCIKCHMPERRTDDVVHVVMTDHFIQRHRPNRDLTAPLQENHTNYKGEVVLYYPKDLPGNLKKLYLGIAQVYNGGDLARGVSLLTDYLQSSPNSFMALMAREVAYKQTGNFAEAIADLKKVLTMKPHYPQGWMALGDAYERQKRHADAVYCYEQAVRLDPNIAMAHNKIGVNRLQMNDLPGAIAACEKAAELDAYDEEPHLNLASAHGQRGDIAAAAEHARKALAIDPSRATGWTLLARSLLDLGRPEGVRDAAWYATEGMRLNPGKAEPFETLRDSLDALSLDQQIAELDRFAADIPLEARVLKARTLLHLNSPEKALQILTDVSDETGGTSYALVLTTAAETATGAGRRGLAISFLQRAVQVEPQDIGARIGLALALAARDAAGEAEALKLLASAPGGEGNPQIVLATAFLKATARTSALRDGRAAEELVKRVVQALGAPDVFALDALAAAQAEQGRYNEALATLGQAIQMARAEGMGGTVGMLQSRQPLYQSGKPLRQGEDPLR